jgi:hypothetical protein
MLHAVATTLSINSPSSSTQQERYDDVIEALAAQGKSAADLTDEQKQFIATGMMPGVQPQAQASSGASYLSPTVIASPASPSFGSEVASAFNALAAGFGSGSGGTGTGGGYGSPTGKPGGALVGRIAKDSSLKSIWPIVAVVGVAALAIGAVVLYQKRKRGADARGDFERRGSEGGVGEISE